MKKITKSLLITAVALAASSSFATSSVTGVDSTGQGSVTFTGTLVSSCTAPTMSVALGNIDFHNQANGTTGVYERSVDVSVNCTNPNQTWMIIPHVSSFQFASGVNGANTEQGYVSFTSPFSAPGALWSMASVSSAFGQATTNQEAAQVLQSIAGAVGTGTSTYTSKLTFGKALPATAVADEIATYSQAASGTLHGGTPVGTIDGRGDFNVDIPLQIVY